MGLELVVDSDLAAGCAQPSENSGRRQRAHTRYRPGLIRIIDRDESPRSPTQVE